MGILKSYLLISKSHLSPRVSGHVDPAEEHPCVARVGGATGGRTRRRRWVGGSAQFRLHPLVILLIYDVVHAVSMDQQVLLRTEWTITLLTKKISTHRWPDANIVKIGTKIYSLRRISSNVTPQIHAFLIYYYELPKHNVDTCIKYAFITMILKQHFIKINIFEFMVEIHL